MAKRKTSCGNARMCSMLLTNFTRSASYEALPHHRLFPARSGSTSRSNTHEKFNKFREYLSKSRWHAPGQTKFNSLAESTRLTTSEQRSVGMNTNSFNIPESLRHDCQEIFKLTDSFCRASRFGIWTAMP